MWGGGGSKCCLLVHRVINKIAKGKCVYQNTWTYEAPVAVQGKMNEGRGGSVEKDHDWHEHPAYVTSRSPKRMKTNNHSYSLSLYI